MSIDKFTGTFSKEDGGVTVMVNETIQSIRNPKTLAIYCYLLSKPPTWRINTIEIQHHFEIGRNVVRNSLNELIELKLLSRYVAKSGNLNAGFHYTLHLRPHAQLEVSRETGFGTPEKGSPYKTKITSLEKKDINTISDLEIVEAYHETLPDSPKIIVLDPKLRSQLRRMKNNWPTYSNGHKSFSIENFKAFLNFIKTHQPRFLQPYATENGNTKQNNLRNITRETNIAKLVNDEFNFK